MEESAAAKPTLWGRVGYVGQAFAAVDGTYEGVRVAPLNFMTTQDSGAARPDSDRARYGNLLPLMMAAMWEAAFVRESNGPLSTWEN